MVFVATNAREMLHLKILETGRYDRSCKSAITQAERRMRCFGAASSILRPLARDGRSEPGCGRAKWNWPHSAAPVLHSPLACIQQPMCSAVQPVSPTHRAAQPLSSSIAGFMKAWKKVKQAPPRTTFTQLPDDTSELTVGFYNVGIQLQI